uniref:Uncharacterized protein n=1 Tax=Noccaea caerulescens TaxID=107243 RepID=A0A1J3JL62_NOCCA
MIWGRSNLRERDATSWSLGLIQLLVAAREEIMFVQLGCLKVEVYFGEDACNSPAGMYSFRNEISALSWILSFIPVSCKLEALRAAVTSRISEVAGGEKKEAIVDECFFWKWKVELYSLGL